MRSLKGAAQDIRDGSSGSFDYQKAVLKQTEEAKVIKKTFLAVAVGAALTGAAGASAATITTPTQSFTDRSIENLTDFAVPDITVVLAAEYQIDDELAFTFDSEVTGDFETTVEVTAADDDFNMTLGLLSTDTSGGETTVVYRVTELTSTDDGVGISTMDATFDIEGDGVLTIAGDPASKNVGLSLTVDMTSTTANLAGEVVTIDTGSSSNMYTVVAQTYTLAAASGSFSKTIDSEVGVDGDYLDDDADGSMSERGNIASRSLFTDGSATDGATINLSESSGAATRTAMTTEVTAVLNGDFTFMTSDDAMTATLGGATPDAVTSTDSTMTYTWTGSELAPVTLGDIVFSFDNTENAAGTAMDPGSFSVDVSVAYSPLADDYVGEEGDNTGHEPAGMGYSDSGAVGSWGIDASTVTVYAVPYSPSASLFIWVTSTTTNDAPYTVTATDPAGTSATVASGVLAPSSITTLSSEILSGLEASDLDYGRVTLTIETSANMCDINVYAGYEQTVDNDRLNLETSQTIQGVHNGGNSGVVSDQCALGYAVAPTPSS